MTDRGKSLTCIGLAIALLSACGSKPAGSDAAKAPTAKIENPKPEGQLTTVTLSADAQKHIGIQTLTVKMESVSLTRTVGGEAIVPPGKTVMITAPMAGTLSGSRTAGAGQVTKGDVIFDLLPMQQTERDARGEAERALQETEARLTQTTQRLQRLEQLLKEGSTSERSVEEARAERSIAAAAADAARKRLESLSVVAVGPRGEVALKAPISGYITALRGASGQTVAAGAPVAEIAQTGALWLRAPVYAGDLASLDSQKNASVTLLGQEQTGPWIPVRRIAGPPAGDSPSASIDLYFESPTGAGRELRPGERVVVRLPLRATETALVVPSSAVVYDMSGGTWVYEKRAENQFARRRVELRSYAGAGLIVTRGLTDGATIVSVGAAELYSTEFYVGK